MPHKILLAALALSSVSAQAQTPSFSLTLTPENDGADTRFSWNISGELMLTNTRPEETGFVTLNFGSGTHSTITGTPESAFIAAIPSITGLSTGLTMTSPSTNQSISYTEVRFFTGVSTASIVLWSTNGAPLWLNPGESGVISGPASGSFLTDIDFSNFTQGTWTNDVNGYNYDPVLIITAGAPIPEPSTYGLMLGGLAFAVVAARRRNRISK